MEFQGQHDNPANRVDEYGNPFPLAGGVGVRMPLPAPAGSSRPVGRSTRPVGSCIAPAAPAQARYDPLSRVDTHMQGRSFVGAKPGYGPPRFL